jgi:hypothetical protein
MPPADKPPQYYKQAGDALRAHLRTNTGVPGSIWHFSCFCGTRLTIEMMPGTRTECLCGAVHEFTDQGTRTV